MTQHTNLYPRLIVAEPDKALDFYQRTMDAEIIERFTDQKQRVVHAAFSVAGAVVSLAQSIPEWGLSDPHMLGGSPCLLHLTVDDPDRRANMMVAGGAKLVIAIADRPWGKREGRVADPSGHLWILSKSIEDVSEEEIRRRLAGQ
jgi:PhnB protein